MSQPGNALRGESPGQNHKCEIRDPGAENSKATSVSVGLVQSREAAGGHARSRLFPTVGLRAAVGLILRSQMISVWLKIFRDGRHMSR